jgi:type I restriction enzyme S subunit
MKPSGIDWLGEIPAHWEVKKLKQLVSIWGRIGFRGYTVADIVDEGEGALAISPSNIVDGMFNRLVRTYVSWDKYYESPEIVVKAGDLLFVKTGSTIGKVCRVSSLNEAMTINPQVVILRPSGCVSIFLKLAIQSSYFQHQVSGRIMGGSTPALNQQNLGSLLLTIPPLCEQEKIADDIISELERCFSAEKKITESISTMDQYRAALITAAVTGQIAELN